MRLINSWSLGSKTVRINESGRNRNHGRETETIVEKTHRRNIEELKKDNQLLEREKRAETGAEGKRNIKCLGDKYGIARKDLVMVI